MQLSPKKAYKVDLSDLHAVCEANYARLIRLFPDYEITTTRELSLGGSRVTLQVAERCRYTTIFVAQQHQSNAYVGPVKLELRAYHDVRMLEVGAIQPRGQVGAAYDYPNARMYQQDEKAQQNRFLAEWLEHCLHHAGAPFDMAVAGPRLPVSDS